MEGLSTSSPIINFSPFLLPSKRRWKNSEGRVEGTDDALTSHPSHGAPPGPAQRCCPAGLCQGLLRPRCSQQSGRCLIAGAGWFCGPGIVKYVRPCDATHGAQDFLVKAWRAAGPSLVLISPLFSFFLVEKGRLQLAGLPAHLQLRQRRCQPRRGRCIPGEHARRQRSAERCPSRSQRAAGLHCRACLAGASRRAAAAAAAGSKRRQEGFNTKAIDRKSAEVRTRGHALT